MKKQITLTEKLAEAVEQYGMRIAGEGTMTKTGHHFYLVTSRDYATTNRMYVVEHHDGTHTCNCPARKPCVHIALVAQTVTQALKDERAVAISDSAKWALIEQIMPERAAAAHQAATEVCALLREMNAKLAPELDENLWGVTPMAEQQAEAERLASQERTLLNVEVSEAEKMEQAAAQTCVSCGKPNNHPDCNMCLACCESHYHSHGETWEQRNRAQAERLAQQPRELVGAETSEETKLEAIEQPVTYAGMVWSNVTNTWELPERVSDSYGAMIDRLSNTDAFWQDAPQAERSAKREAAILATAGAFSIYASE